MALRARSLVLVGVLSLSCLQRDAYAFDPNQFPSGGSGQGQPIEQPIGFFGQQASGFSQSELPTQEQVQGWTNTASNSDLEATSRLQYGPPADGSSVEPGGSQASTSAPGGPDSIQGAPGRLPVVFQDSVSGLADTMKQDAYREMATNLLSSPMAIMNITWQLTEPGVAQGMSNAFQQAAGMLANRYSAQQALLSQYAYDPVSGPRNAAEFINCQRRKVAEMAQAGQTGESAWIAANSACAGDQDTSAAPAGGAAGPAAAATVSTTGRVYTRADSPSREVPMCDGLAPGQMGPPSTQPGDICSQSGGTQDPNRSCLTDALPAEPAELRATFREYYGDLSYPQSGVSQAGEARAMMSEVCFVPPTTPPSNVMSEYRERYWNEIFSILQARCEKSAELQGSSSGAGSGGFGGIGQVCTSGSCTSDTYTPFKQTQQYSFWVTFSKERLDNLAIVGFSLTPANIDIIYNMFKERLEVQGTSASACQEFFGTQAGQRNNLKELVEQTQQQGQSQSTRTLVVTEGHIAVDFIVKKLVLGKLYSAANNAAQLIQRTSLGAFEADKELAQRLVANAVGLSDIYGLNESYQRNIAELRQFTDALQLYGARLSGRGGQGFSGAFTTRETGSSLSNPLMPSN